MPYRSKRKSPTYIDLARDWSPTLGPKYQRDGEFSGEEFRETVLVPALRDTEDTLCINLDTFASASHSFFQEAFGGCVRDYPDLRAGERLVFCAVDRAYLAHRIKHWMT